jgi:hypothetical protein
MSHVLDEQKQHEIRALRRPDGTEIFYRRGPRLMAARVDKSAGVKVVSTRVALDPSCRRCTTTTTFIPMAARSL